MVSCLSTHHLVLMFLALYVLLDLHVEYTVIRRHLRLFVHLQTTAAQQLVAIQTLGRRLPMLPTDQLTDVTEWVFGRLLSPDHLRQTRYEEVVGKLLDAADRKLRALPAQRTREVPIVAVFLLCEEQ